MEEQLYNICKTINDDWENHFGLEEENIENLKTADDKEICQFYFDRIYKCRELMGIDEPKTQEEKIIYDIYMLKKIELMTNFSKHKIPEDTVNQFLKDLKK